MNFDQVRWDEFKSFVNERSLSIQFRETSEWYFMRAADHWFGLDCNLNKSMDTSEVSDFETNYKSLGNSSLNSEVVTQFEKRDKTLKLAHGEATVDSETGLATILLKIPGTPGSADGRWISSGIAFFDAHTAGDKVIGVYFTDEDNILEQGAGFVVGSYTDDDTAESERGWAIAPSGWIKAEAIGGYGFAPSGFYIKVIAQKAGESPSGTFYCNFEWGKTD